MVQLKKKTLTYSSKNKKIAADQGRFYAQAREAQAQGDKFYKK